MYSGHYTTSINCCKFYYNESKSTELQMINTKNSFNACSDAQINYVMGFGINQEDEILITPHGADTSNPSH